MDDGRSHEHPHPHASDPADDGVSRRRFLQGGAAALGVSVLGPVISDAARVPAAASLSGLAPATAAMHVHASYSEGRFLGDPLTNGVASWEQQYASAAAQGIDVLWQTDHDFRARAQNYMTLLRGTWLASTTGSWAQHAGTFSASGPIRVMVESAGSTPASQILAMQDHPTAVNIFRTGIHGQRLVIAFGTSRLGAGALFEVVWQLSRHPAQNGRPAGIYSLRYRFGPGLMAGRATEGSGLVGIVRAAMPANGATITLTPETDIAAIWPDMLAMDHASSLLTFVATSPRRGSVADVNLRSVTVNRAAHDAAGVASAQQTIRDRCTARYPVRGFLSEEVSHINLDVAHVNAFGSPPEWSLKSGVTATNWRTYFRDFMTRVHGRGGVASWNHPFGTEDATLLPATQQDQRRREVFAARLADNFLGADILEVGYAVRGQQPFSQHLALWDTFSRRARFMTGNGANDDHSGQDWNNLINGFVTGLWSPSTAEPDLVRALLAGRAFTYLASQAPGLDIDILVGGTVPMGGASVSTAGSRTIAIGASNLPSGAVVELVRGPVDFTGQDPATTVVASFARSAFGASGTGTVSTGVNTATACFVRPQVRLNGTLIATGNPTWLLRTPPPGGIPAPRQS